MGWFLCIVPKETEGVFSSCCLCWWGEMNGWLEEEWWELLCMTSRCIQVRDEPPKRSHLDDDYLQSIVLPLSVKKYWLLKFSSWRKETMQSDERGRKHKVLFVWLNKDPFFDESTPTWNRFKKKWAGFFFFLMSNWDTFLILFLFRMRLIFNLNRRKKGSTRRFISLAVLKSYPILSLIKKKIPQIQILLFFSSFFFFTLLLWHLLNLLLWNVQFLIQSYFLMSMVPWHLLVT